MEVKKLDDKTIEITKPEKFYYNKEELLLRKAEIEDLLKLFD